MDDAVGQYLKLRDEVDRRAAELARRHGRHIVCRPGCSACCVNLTVLPVEFEAIRRSLAGAAGPAVSFDGQAPCGYLVDGLCAIYPQRPIICRTHGLPIAFRNDEDQEWSVSFCERNFANAGQRDLEFGPESTLDLDDLNDRLARINLAYLVGAGARGPTPGSRIELRRLVEDD